MPSHSTTETADQSTLLRMAEYSTINPGDTERNFAKLATGDDFLSAVNNQRHFAWMMTAVYRTKPQKDDGGKVKSDQTGKNVNHVDLRDTTSSLAFQKASHHPHPEQGTGAEPADDRGQPLKSWELCSEDDFFFAVDNGQYEKWTTSFWTIAVEAGMDEKEGQVVVMDADSSAPPAAHASANVLNTAPSSPHVLLQATTQAEKGDEQSAENADKEHDVVEATPSSKLEANRGPGFYIETPGGRKFIHARRAKKFNKSTRQFTARFPISDPNEYYWDDDEYANEEILDDDDYEEFVQNWRRALLTDDFPAGIRNWIRDGGSEGMWQICPSLFHALFGVRRESLQFGTTPEGKPFTKHYSSQTLRLLWTMAIYKGKTILNHNDRIGAKPMKGAKRHNDIQKGICFSQKPSPLRQSLSAELSSGGPP
ncbi:hypothetical protein B0T25DRAFT_313427 [Lasiosphaeria hispida]|uniref:Uncharacterized protein n=1 Tax=Lasiosphaeria hispida TaxID=260671 RepID=A0AAJ0H925_9PEZI|nr:hypothetical protein B0T25DRAFT_313427 [Lasiosphaeria hispida]